VLPKVACNVLKKTKKWHEWQEKVTYDKKSASNRIKKQENNQRGILQEVINTILRLFKDSKTRLAKDTKLIGDMRLQ
jgi:hypothetical protein